MGPSLWHERRCLSSGAGRQRACRRPRRDSGGQPVQPAIVPGGSQLSGVLPVTAVFDNVTDPPELKMPPPWAATLPVTWLLCDVTAPPSSGVPETPLASPPPSPPARLSFTRLLLRLRVVEPVPGGP